MSWGTSFAPSATWPEASAELKTAATIVLERDTGITPELLGVKPERNNLVPTHDPYTNPNAQIYYSCGCGAILDPGTKRFAELNNVASAAGWKIRFSDSGYTPYCVACGVGVE